MSVFSAAVTPVCSVTWSFRNHCWFGPQKVDLALYLFDVLYLFIYYYNGWK